MTYPAIALDTISSSQSQREVTFNEIASGLSKATLFGVKQRQTSGLTLTLYGGVFPGLSGPVLVADKTLTLTPSATNYISVNAVGVVSATTSIPDGWPGPMATAARALYELDVGTDAITDGVDYVVGPGQPGVVGPIGSTGLAGLELYQQRRRLAGTHGSGSGSLTTSIGMAVSGQGGSLAARSLDTSFFTGCIPYTAKPAGPSANSTGAFYSTGNWCHLGTATGRGGFDFFIRWCYESTFSGATTRRFVGLRDNSVGNFSSADPDSFVNIIGVGNNSADANLSIMHNAGSGTATMTTLGSNFPARTTNNTYELRLRSEPNSQSVDYSLLDAGTGNTATGTLTANIPAGGTFLGWAIMTDNGSTSGTTTFGFMDLSCNARY